MSKDNATVLKIKGLLMYPKLFQPDTFYEPKWTTDLLLDKEALKYAQEHGLRISKTRTPKKKGKKPYDPYAGLYDGYDGSYLKLDRSCKNSKKEDTERPMVKDATGRTDVPTDVRIGNGTLANALFMVKTRDRNGKQMSISEAMEEFGGYGMYLLGVQILDLVEYEGNGSGFDSEDEGYQVGGDTVDLSDEDNPFDNEEATG